MNNKYIEKLVLYDTLNEKEFSLEFKSGMNILIGSKGGGKSTILKILHAMHNHKKIKKSLLDTLAEFNLKIISIIYSNTETVIFQNLQSNDEDNEDIILQDDDIKTSMNDIKQIQKDREIFIDEIINTSVKTIINQIKKYYETFLNIRAIKNNRMINWNIIMNFTKNDEALTTLKFLLDDSTKLIKTENKNIKLHGLLRAYKDLLKKDDEDTYNKFQNTLNELQEIHWNKSLSEINKVRINNIYKEWLVKQRMKSKESNNMDAQVTSFKKDAQSFVKEIAIELARNNCLFQYLNNPTLNIKLDKQKDTKYGMKLSIKENINLNEVINDNTYESWMLSVFEKILMKPSNKTNQWTNWLESSYKSSSEKASKDNFDKILKLKLLEQIEDYVKLLADGKDYESMSLGTRTSYGIKQKIKEFSKPILFLDQPEDNLDNYTIFNELINIFGEGKQFFMVTHNSNFGTLTNPQTITTCSLNKYNPISSYSQENNLTSIIDIPSELNIKDSPVRHYLEGGKNSLKERYIKLVELKGDK